MRLVGSAGRARERLRHGLGRGRVRASRNGVALRGDARSSARGTSRSRCSATATANVRHSRRARVLRPAHATRSSIEEAPSPALTPELRAGDGGRRARARCEALRPRRGHDRVPGRRRQALLLHRDEHAACSSSTRSLRAPRDQPGRGPTASPRARVPRRRAAPSCAGARSFRASTPRIPRTLHAGARPGRALPPTARSGRPRRHARLRGLPDPAVLRLADRQGDRLGQDRPPALAPPSGRCEFELVGVPTTRDLGLRDRFARDTLPQRQLHDRLHRGVGGRASGSGAA